MKHNNRFIQCIIFSLISLILSQEKIAIIPFTPNGVDDITAMEITSRFTFELSKTNRYDIIEREMMNKILDEQKFQTSGCVTDTCIVEIGQLIGVKKIVAGSVSKIENLYTINIRLIDVATGQILHHGMGSFEESIKDFLNITVKNTALKMAAETTTILGDNDGSTGQYSSTKTGNIIFNINKLGVAIYLDGRYNSIGTGNTVSFTLTEGTHDIKFSLSGFRDWQKEISIIAGEQLVYDVEMRTGLSTEGQAVNLTGILLVYSDPDGATVFVDGVNKGTTLLQITDIGSGTHEIRVEKNLYYQYSEIVEITPDAIIEVQANLNPRFGKLTITSDPPGCVIKLNDQTKGRTPYIVNQIESGTYKITVSKELYHTHNDNYIITDGSTNQRHIDLTPAFGNLRITSTPSGAEVKIDSEPRGLTPFVLDELPSGKYNLSLLLDLYQTIEKTILIEDGKTNDMDIRLEARFALLSVTGLPAGADIHANGELIGSIPLQKYRIPEGMVELKIAADKYHTHTEFLNIRRGQPVNQTVSLKRHTGKLIVITEPPGAEIFLDDRSVGESPKILDEIPIGNHSILVDHPDYLEDYKEFNLTLDEKEEFRFKLLTYQGSIDQQIDQIKSKRKKYLYVTIASAVLGAYMNYSANQSYDQYIKSNSSSSAKSNYNKTVLQDKLSSGGYGLALVGTIPLIKMSADIKNLEKQLTSNEANPTKTGDGIK